MRKIFLVAGLVVVGFVFQYCSLTKSYNVDHDLDYCISKARKVLDDSLKYPEFPRRIERGSITWDCVDFKDWTSGFWPGVLWYAYEYTHDESLKAQADSFTRMLTPLSQQPAYDHDLGFMVFCSFGNGLRLMNDPEYKKIILRTADTLATLYKPIVGTILSWPGMVKENNWPHNTIIDNMMNLELLFWAAKNGENKRLYDIAVKHAQVTMKNHFRPDFSCYHVVVYDSITGKKIKGVTHQGYSDESMWARGQAWAIYGYTMCYRETQLNEFLDFSRKIADVYLKNLPDDYIPYWDFKAPGIPNEPRDASAAAITASALLELSQLVKDKEAGEMYLAYAQKMLKSLSKNYQSKSENDAFLLHSTGHKPKNKEIDVSLIYADYYYLEALLRLKKIQSGKSIYEHL